MTISAIKSILEDESIVPTMFCTTANFKFVTRNFKSYSLDETNEVMNFVSKYDGEDAMVDITDIDVIWHVKNNTYYKNTTVDPSEMVTPREVGLYGNTEGKF